MIVVGTEFLACPIVHCVFDRALCIRTAARRASAGRSTLSTRCVDALFLCKRFAERTKLTNYPHRL